MNRPDLAKPCAALIWCALAFAMLAPLILAAQSPLLAWRSPVYIAAGFAGVAAMALLLLQPLLAAARLPGMGVRRARRLHLGAGCALLIAVIIHLAGLWITSPPDVIDALLLRSPTPFSAWGVMAMWALFGAALLAAYRRRMRWRLWRIAHGALAALTVTGAIIHALLIEGTMEIISKTALCALVGMAAIYALAPLIKPRK